MDTSARAYARHVYLALTQGLTVKQAFHKGQAGVIASSNVTPPCCCAHLHTNNCRTCPYCRTPVCCRGARRSLIALELSLHVAAVHTAPCHQAATCCQPELPHNESLKFMLLPQDGNHGARELCASLLTHALMVHRRRENLRRCAGRTLDQLESARDQEQPAVIARPLQRPLQGPDPRDSVRHSRAHHHGQCRLSALLRS